MRTHDTTQAIGRTNGFLTIIRYHGKDKHGHHRYVAACAACGGESKPFNLADFKKLNSCRCLSDARFREMARSRKGSSRRRVAQTPAVTGDYHFKIYRATNRLTGLSYIGYTTTTAASRWRQHLTAARHGGETYLCRAIRQYGTDCWTIETVYEGFGSLTEAGETEVKFIADLGTLSPMGYNLSPGGERGASGMKRTEATKMLISNARLGTHLSEEHKQRLSVAMKGRSFSEETRRKLSERQRGELNHRFGKRLSDEEREALSERIRGESNPFYGKKHSEETKERLRRFANRKVNHGIANHAAKSVVIDGVVYGTLLDALTAHKITRSILRRRLESPAYPTWHYLVNGNKDE